MLKKALLVSSLALTTFATAVASTPWGHTATSSSNRSTLMSNIMINFGPSDVTGIEAHHSANNYMHAYARQDGDRSVHYAIEYAKFNSSSTYADMQMKLRSGNYTVMGLSAGNKNMWWIRQY